MNNLAVDEVVRLKRCGSQLSSWSWSWLSEVENANVNVKIRYLWYGMVWYGT